MVQNCDVPPNNFVQVVDIHEQGFEDHKSLGKTKLAILGNHRNLLVLLKLMKLMHEGDDLMLLFIGEKQQRNKEKVFRNLGPGVIRYYSSESLCII